jgi:hypothetical protein
VVLVELAEWVGQAGLVGLAESAELAEWVGQVGLAELVELVVRAATIGNTILSIAAEPLTKTEQPQIALAERRVAIPLTGAKRVPGNN